ncbi:MAG: alpha/beta hydrolase family protein [Flavobacteriales bacterium]
MIGKILHLINMIQRSTHIIIFLLITVVSCSQSITGDWKGTLQMGKTQLRIVFHIKKTDTGYKSTMDSPDQGAKGLPVTKTEYNEPEIHLKVSSIGLSYKGKIDKGKEKIKGTLKQRGQSFDMILKKGEYPDDNEKTKQKRPQEPKKPFPYYTENVKFQNKKDSITLAGTLTMPKKKGEFPAVILISGSGPHNRNEEIMGHKPFKVIADHLTQKGIAVLRYDERGVGKSTGDRSKVTTKVLSKDAKAAFHYLQKRKAIDNKNIGFIGHSEGGVIAPMVAAEIQKTSFIVLLAGTGMPGDKILLRQNELMMKASGKDSAYIRKTNKKNKEAYELAQNIDNDDSLRKALGNLYEKSINKAMQVYSRLKTHWMQFFLKYDPKKALKKVDCPVLALNGEKDLQVPPENLKAIKKALREGGNDKVTTKEFKGLNHLFQKCETGLPAEYGQIEQTIEPVVLKEIAKWINSQVQ